MRVVCAVVLCACWEGAVVEARGESVGSPAPARQRRLPVKRVVPPPKVARQREHVERDEPVATDGKSLDEYRRPFAAPTLDSLAASLPSTVHGHDGTAHFLSQSGEYGPAGARATSLSATGLCDGNLSPEDVLRLAARPSADLPVVESAVQGRSTKIPADIRRPVRQQFFGRMANPIKFF